MDGKLWNKGFALCLLLQTVYMLSFNMVTPLIAQYAVLIGETTAMAGLIAGMFSFCALAFRPFVGYASDHVNRNRFMLVGLIIGAVAMVGYGLSQTAAMLVIFRILHALALSIQTTVITVIAIDFIPSPRIAEGVGYVGIAAMVGMSLGPGLGVAVAEGIGHTTAFFGGAALMLGAAAVSFALPVTTYEPPPPTRFSLAQTIDVDAIPLSLSALSFAFCAGLTSSFMVLLGDERGISGIAWFFFISSLGMVFVRPIAGRITDRRGLTGIALVGFASEGLAVTAIAFAASLPLILAGAVFRIFGQGAAQSSIQGCVLKDAPDERRGVASSTFYLGIDAGQGLGAIIGGAIADSCGYAAAFLSGPCVLGVGFLAFLWWKLRAKRPAPHRTEMDSNVSGKGRA